MRRGIANWPMIESDDPQNDIMAIEKRTYHLYQSETAPVFAEP